MYSSTKSTHFDSAKVHTINVRMHYSGILEALALIYTIREQGWGLVDHTVYQVEFSSFRSSKTISVGHFLYKRAPLSI